MRTLLTLVTILILTAAGPAWAGGGVELTDDELGEVFARGVEVEPLGPNALAFQFDDIGGNRVQVDGSGDLQFGALQLANTASTNTVQVSDNAQQNLRALVNVNAANAILQVLINLNINVDSVVNGLSQTNIGNLQ